MAISAVPGSGKTFTLSLLAAQLIASGRLDVAAGQQVLIVTYLNATVDTFRARVRQRLDELNKPLLGYDVRTLHSLALEIVKNAMSGTSSEADFPTVADESQGNNYLARAVDDWIEAYPEHWYAFLPAESPQNRVRWRGVTERTARTFIRAAKNERYIPAEIQRKIGMAVSGNEIAETISTGLRQQWAENVDDFTLTWMLSGIYERYQAILSRQGLLDFDDLIWRAVNLLEESADLAHSLHQRWPYVLEDEAQDSVPLQEKLLSLLTGKDGNWVRVGDPNQAITSTFTAAHPRYFNAFADRNDVVSLPLPNSGRSAPIIFNAANRLIHWVCDNHPVTEVRQQAFRKQDILPTAPGDAQINPPDEEATLQLKVFKHRDDEELPAIARLADGYTKQHPDHTVAILVPTHESGHSMAQHLDTVNAAYDNLLRGSGRAREIAATLHAILALLANPQDRRALASFYAALQELDHPSVSGEDVDLDRIDAILRSVHSPESLFYPADSESIEDALPAGVVTSAEIDQIARLATITRSILKLRPLAIDDLILALSDKIFIHHENSDDGKHEADLATAYHLATLVRQWQDAQPEWRLPELVTQLSDLAEGRRQIPFTTAGNFGFDPEPGRITLATQHGSKGMEWDAVFLVGIDGFWIPGNLEAAFLGVEKFFGGDPGAEAIAQLGYLMEGDAGLLPGLTATQSAHVEVISERLRLLYVGITRARRFLHISRSRWTRRYNKDYESQPASALGILYQYLKSYQPVTSA